MINTIKCDIQDIKQDVSNIYEKLEKTTNHLSKRLPSWASALFMILTAILGGLLVKALG